MRIVLVTYGSEGDSRPVLALAWGLTRAGHEIVVLADQSATEPAARLGVEFHPLRGSMRRTMSGDASAMRRVMETGRMRLAALNELTGMYADWTLQIDAAAAGADAIIGTSLAAPHALSVADLRGIPALGAGYHPYLGTREFAHPLSGMTRTAPWMNRPIARTVHLLMWTAYRRSLNRERRSLGHPRLLRLPDHPGLGAWSPTLVPTPKDWRSDFTVTGDWHPSADHPALGWSDWEPDPALREFLDAGEPPIYVGFGSMTGFGDRARLRGSVLEAFAGRRVLLSGGWAELAEGELPKGVLAIGRVPHGWLFPQCAAVVHHSGAGTAHAAARAGVPSIPVPFTADQPFWADRLWRLGIASRRVNRHRITSNALRDAFAQVDRPGVRERAVEVAAEMADEDGVGTAVRVIERHLGDAPNISAESTRDVD